MCSVLCQISHIKKKVEELEGIPPEQQRLVFAGKQMADDQSAKTYAIEGEMHFPDLNSKITLLDSNSPSHIEHRPLVCLCACAHSNCAAGATLHLVLALRGGSR
eukprot:TRINITY_DN909_c0_g1_i5.p1 TRINITY_DN909_c0_g1~~TRINITY_DN909_c0_g1_i5.p1  ORF type:complete len:104 (+),score=26.34 TRINITY_DN909_c0_g1_i5:615-926(+)